MTNPNDFLDSLSVETTQVASDTALEHYYWCALSRACSVIARREVLNGRAKFGITGDGKELPQVALATQFEPGDWRSGYYRDQTLMMATGLASVEDYFSQLYADPGGDPFSGGRQMVCHFATPTIDAAGHWIDQTSTKNVSADISCTAGQMARGLGLAFASKKYRENPALAEHTGFSRGGREICWVTIGDASTSEGIFWESINAAGVLQVPMVISVWDDGYGISVPIEYQTTKGSISAALAGLRRDDDHHGLEIIRCFGWDYPGLLEAYARAARLARESHIPVLVHVQQVTQQLGHSTSGSHERYKSASRMSFEREHDCNARFAQWIERNGLADSAALTVIRTRAEEDAKAGQRASFERVSKRHADSVVEAVELLGPKHAEAIKLSSDPFAGTTEALATVRRVALSQKLAGGVQDWALVAFAERATARGMEDYASSLHLEGPGGVHSVAAVPARFDEKAASVPGYKILNEFFDDLFGRDPRVMAFGEDVGKIGDVNQGFAGLQEKYGESRIFDCGIREWSIVGQAIGLALRGLRPIAEIQYLDYLIYGISALSDDLACLLYRSDGIQRAPVIIRTRGHRLEGIWHSGSPMGMIVNSLRGMHVCVPRNMLQAVGMYNTLMQADEPALVVECLNGYRLRERKPINLTEYTVPLGQVDVVRTGTELTLVSYGACMAICEEAVDLLAAYGHSVELIDVQTLLPFDLAHGIADSLRKTSRLLIVDEDVPGGASGYILDEILNRQNAFSLLDASPKTLSAHAHRPPYGSEGDYITKPNVEDVVEAVMKVLGA